MMIGIDKIISFQLCMRVFTKGAHSNDNERFVPASTESGENSLILRLSKNY